MRKKLKLFIIVSLLFAISFGVYAEDKPAGTQDEILKIARESFVNADFKNAIEQYKAAYDRDNGNAKAVYGLIESLIYANRWWEAYGLAETEEKKKPKDPLIICAIARANYKTGEIRKAYDLTSSIRKCNA